MRIYNQKFGFIFRRCCVKYLLLALSLLSVGCSSEPEITLPNVEQVGMNDANAILKAIHDNPIQVIDSTDSRDAVKKIYKFDNLFSQLELSSNFALISWKHKDETSLNRAVKLGIATLGNDAGYFIHRVDLNGEHTDYSIKGHKIMNNMCISEICTIKIEK